MKIRNPNYKDDIANIFQKANFIQDLGMQLVDCGPGWCKTVQELEDRHMQQDGVVHFGVQATVADHTAGAAAATLIATHQYPLTAQCTIHLLRPASGERLHGRARVLKAGRTLSVVESEVWVEAQGIETLVAKATVSIAIVQKAGQQ